eukprot:TRINITY_DN37040_c0_g1_i1.p1 TRINITY_DN37040_c0_g1~~TRINITY_DN37040_c0_g1_i1.p1  ORF type:complete len:311 (+),score=39.83 TRINITY_DN37040_c0_g1_i1:90-935(+)
MRIPSGARIREYSEIAIYVGSVLNYLLVANQAMKFLKVGGRSRKLIAVVALIAVGMANACREALKRMRQTEIAKLENDVGFKGGVIATSINSYFPALEPLAEGRWLSFADGKLFEIDASSFSDPQNRLRLASAPPTTTFLRDLNATHLFTVTEGVSLDLYCGIHQFSYFSVKSSLQDLIRHIQQATGPISCDNVRVVENTYSKTRLSVAPCPTYVRTPENLSTDIKGLGASLFRMCTNTPYNGENTLLISKCAPSRFSKLIIDMLAGELDLPEIQNRASLL